MLKKHNFFFLFCFLCIFTTLSFLAYAGGKKEKPEDSKMEVVYSKQINPGDPVFVLLRFSSPPVGFESARIFLQTTEEKKEGADARLYLLPKSDSCEYMAAIPLSTFTQPGEYVICLEIVWQQSKIIEKYPVEITPKEFVSETIKLDGRNTAIKTDSGVKRAKQVERLYEILKTTNYEAAASLSQFVLPVNSKRRTSFFGDRRVYMFNNGKSSTELHYGIDFGVPRGTPVVNCAEGTVVLAEERVTTGFSVVIEHMPGLYSLYYHLDALSVAEGAAVRAGDQIGVSGATGLATGPHLHWEIRLLGEAVNPDYFITQTISE